jgi:hypothetical protein
MANYLPRTETARILMNQVGDELMCAGWARRSQTCPAPETGISISTWLEPWDLRPQPGLDWRWHSLIAWLSSSPEMPS